MINIAQFGLLIFALIAPVIAFYHSIKNNSIHYYLGRQIKIE